MFKHEATRTSAAATRQSGRAVSRGLLGAGVAAAVLGGMALANHLAARRSERRHPPRGRFVEVDGVRLHYLEAGHGTPVVLLHGNGATADDFVASGLFHRLAARHRVIAFDRPGFGHTPRPRGRVWTAHAQAELIHAALRRLSADRPVLVGHSWATLVALNMALDHPQDFAAVVLLSGFYYPAARLDVPAMSVAAVPLLGNVLCQTILPLVARLMLPRIIRWLFAPSPVTPRFRAQFPLPLSLRPSQIRAGAGDTALMIPGTLAICRRYGELSMPLVLAAGTRDNVVDFRSHSARLHRDVPHSRLHAIATDGHMIHHTATAEVEAAIDEAIALAATRAAA